MSPFSLAENKLRQSRGMPLRTFYAPTSRGKSVAAQQKHGAAESRIKR
jgi:hypothetical protein